jgi:DNA-binding transcriptional MerR regulator
MAGTRGKLGRKREQVIMALLTCRTVQQAAEQSGVSLSSIMRWQREEPFRKALEAAKTQLLRAATLRLAANVGEAAETIGEIVRDGDAPKGARLQASVSTFRLLQDDRVLETLEERIRKLEAQGDEVA